VCGVHTYRLIYYYSRFEYCIRIFTRAPKIKNTKILTITALIIATTIALFTAQAGAITGNPTPSTEPYVGIIVLFGDAARTQPIGYSSGFLISPTVMVTAGHSLVGAQAVSVCFDQGPIAYTIENGQLTYYGTSAIYTGTPITYPACNPTLHGNQEFQTSDIGLIILDQPVTTVTEFPTLPTASSAEAFDKKTNLTAIGYGMQTQTTSKNNGPTTSWIGKLSRNSATVQIVKIDELYLKLTANSAQGKGAIVFGDSGGPVIYTVNGQDVAIAVNAFVSSSNCNGVSYHTLLDNTQVLAWISSYLV
jgi:hypothetical protein